MNKNTSAIQIGLAAFLSLGAAAGATAPAAAAEFIGEPGAASPGQAFALGPLAVHFDRLGDFLENPSASYAALNSLAARDTAARRFKRLLEDSALRQEWRPQLLSVFGAEKVNQLEQAAQALGSSVSAASLDKGLESLASDLAAAKGAEDAARALARFDDSGRSDAAAPEAGAGAPEEKSYYVFPNYDERVLAGHTSAVKSAAWSPDGSKIVTASDDGTARIYDAASGAPLKVLTGYYGGVISAVWSPDGSKIVTANENKTARVYDAATGGQLQVLGHCDSVNSVSWSPDGSKVATSSSDGAARIFNAATGKLLRVLKASGEVLSAAWSPDGFRIAATSADGTARIYDAATGELLRRLYGNSWGVTSAVWSPDGSKIVTASLDGRASLYNAATGEKLREAGAADWLGPIWGIPPYSRKAYAASVENPSIPNLSIYNNGESGKELPLLRGRSSGVWSPDGSKVATASGDGTARVYDAVTGKELRVLKGHTDWLYSIAWSPDGSKIATASADKTVRVWSVHCQDELVALIRGLEARIESVREELQARLRQAWDF